MELIKKYWCKEKISKYKNPIISVTGTSGKTTTTKMIHDIIKSTYTVNKTYKNFNTILGIPVCVNTYFDLNSQYWVIEMGILKINEMSQLRTLGRTFLL
jgi:UDP-N-acetylmuramyl pentapeptide synthase